MDGLQIDGARWVPADNLHITLAFLGETLLVEDVAAAVTQAAAWCRPFPLTLSGTGAFPSARRARVVWLGLSGDTDALRAAARETWRALEPHGFTPEDRPFSAHLTIARLKEPGRVDLPPFDPVAVPVEAITLFRSRLGRPAPAYERLQVSKLD